MRRLTVLLVTFAALGTLGYYTYFLKQLDLREWERYRIVFQKVSGLEEGDEVQILGVVCGRVAAIEIIGRDLCAEVEITPGTRIGRRGYHVEVVSENAFGTMTIHIDPGDTAGECFSPGASFGGFSRPPSAMAAMLDSPPAEARDAILDVVLATRSLTGTDTTFGELLNGSVRAEGFRQTLGHLAEGVDALAADLDAAERGEGTLGALVARADGLAAAVEALRGIESVIDDIRLRLEMLLDPEGGLVTALAEPEAARALAAQVRSLHAGLRDAAAPAGPLDALSRGGAESWERMGDGIASARGWLQGAAAEEGMLARLAHDEALAEALAGAAESAAATTGEAAAGEGFLGALLRDEGLRREVGEGGERLEEMSRNLREGVQMMRRGQVMNTFHGAVFLVF